MILESEKIPEQTAPAPVRSSDLLCCPSCNFDDAAYEEHVKKAAHYAGKKEMYMPKLYKDRFLKKWVIECQNCGMEIVFNSETETEHAELWNALPRKQHNDKTHPRGFRVGVECFVIKRGDPL